MTLPNQTRVWASDANFSSGPAVGTPTKVDPGAGGAAQGFVPGTPSSAAQINFEVNALTVAYNNLIVELQAIALDEQLARLRADLHVHPLGYVTDDTGSAMAATMVDGIGAPLEPVVAIKVDSSGVALVRDSSLIDVGSAVASITSAVRDAATNGSRIVAIGTGGNLATYSDNGGGTWSATVAGIAGAVEHIVYMPPNALSGGGDRFICGGSGTGSAYRNDDAGTGTWDALASTFPAVLGLAVLGNPNLVGGFVNAGYCVALGASGGKPRFSVLTDGGNGADFNGTQQPPNAADADEPGSIAGAPLVPGIRDAVYHCMRCDSGARLRITKSIDGFTWNQPSNTIEAPTGDVFNGAPRLMICQSTGLAVIVVELNSGAAAVYASVDLENWTEPLVFKQPVTAAYAVAGGRLFFTDGDTIWASARHV